jgi:acetyl-CoA/propionyl-CoA carboxylase biotin carboxyl carrier protein
MVSKLIVWAPDRASARARLRRAIDDYTIGGVPTTLGFLRALNDSPHVVDGSYGTATLESFATTWAPAQSAPASASGDAGTPATTDSDVVRIEVNGKLFNVRMIDAPPLTSTAGTSSGSARALPRKTAHSKAKNGRVPSGNDVIAPMHGVVVEVSVAAGDDVNEGQVVAVIEAMKMMNEIRAHRAGSVAAVHANKGATVEANAPILSLA